MSRIIKKKDILKDKISESFIIKKSEIIKETKLVGKMIDDAVDTVKDTLDVGDEEAKEFIKGVYSDDGEINETGNIEYLDSDFEPQSEDTTGVISEDDKVSDNATRKMITINYK